MSAEDLVDRIEKSIVLRAPRTKVWHALTDSDAFGTWFGVRLGGPMVAGARLAGRITDPGWEDYPFEIKVERMEPERLLSWRWHPHAVDRDVDYTSEPTTLVVFELDDVGDGTRLTVVESGFDKIPAARRAKAFRGNEVGWSNQLAAVDRYVATSR